MAKTEKPEVPQSAKAKPALTRRELLRESAKLGAAGVLMAGCGRTKKTPERLSEENLIGASELSGEVLSTERVRGMRSIFEFNLKHLQILREFDPDEEEPLTMFRV